MPTTDRARNGRAGKVLFFSHDGKLGDAIVNTAFVAGLKRWDPECEIHATVAASTVDFWRADDRVAKLWPTAPAWGNPAAGQRKPGWRASWRFGRELRRERFNYIVTWHPMRSEKNRLLLWLAAPGKVIDLRAFKQGPVRHKIEACAEAMAQIGAQVQGPLAYDLRMAPHCLDIDARYPRGREVILVNLFAADAERNIGHDRGVALLRGLHEAAPGAALCLLCSDATEGQARAVSAACGLGELVNCEGKLPRLLRICQRADLVISPDTAVVHIACAFQTPVVGIYQNNGVKPVQWGPLGPDTAIVLSRCAHTLDGFDVAEVIERAAALRGVRITA